MATLDEVYFKFGEVSEAAQLLETELANILMILGAADAGLFEQPDRQAAEELFNRINRHSLGQLLERLHRSTDAAAQIEEQLRHALKERNRLAHSFYRQHNFRRNSPEGCAVMLQDLRSIHNVLLGAYKSALQLSGTDLDKIEMDVPPTGHLPI